MSLEDIRFYDRRPCGLQNYVELNGKTYSIGKHVSRLKVMCDNEDETKVSFVDDDPRHPFRIYGSTDRSDPNAGPKPAIKQNLLLIILGIIGFVAAAIVFVILGLNGLRISVFCVFFGILCFSIPFFEDRADKAFHALCIDLGKTYKF